MTILDLSKKLDDIQAIIDDIRKQLIETYPHNNVIDVQIERITDAVEKQYGLPKGSVYKQNRKREIVDSRDMSMLLIYDVMKKGVTKTGLLFKRDAPGVIHSKKTIRNLININADTHDKFIRVCDELELDKDFVNQIITNTVPYVRANRL